MKGDFLNMKEKNKISLVYLITFIILSVVEIICIHFLLGDRLKIYWSTDFLAYLKLYVVSISANLVYFLSVLDTEGNVKREINKKEKPLRSYRKDVNYYFRNRYYFIAILKTIILCFLETSLKFSFIKLQVVLCVIFQVSLLIYQPKENKEYKIKKLKRQLNKNKLDMQIIMFEEESGDKNSKCFVSTFDPYHTFRTKVNRQNIYIDYKKDFENIVKSFPKNKQESIRKQLLKNVVVYIKRAKSQDSKEFLDFWQECKKQNWDLPNNYLVLTFDNIKKIYVPNEVSYISALKMCKTEKYVEFVEDLVRPERKFAFEKKHNILSKMRLAIRTYFMKKEKIFKSEEEKQAYYTKNLQRICKEKYNMRLTKLTKTMPNNEDLRIMYKNVFLQDSIHQSYMILLNYISMLHQIVAYYLYAKNNQNFDCYSLNKKIIDDNYIKYADIILKNVKNIDEIYRNIKELEYYLPKEKRELLDIYVSKLLSRDFDIADGNVDYGGMVYLTACIRNKIQAHGTISDENAYLFWNVCYELAEFFNKVFKVWDLSVNVLENDIKRSNNKSSQENSDNQEFNKNCNIGIKYSTDDKFTNMGEYVRAYDGECYIAQSGNNGKILMVNYLKGELIKPSVVNYRK